MIQSVKKFIQVHDLFQYGDALVLGVSGGSDSIALVYILNELKHEMGLTLHLAHFDHGLRSESISEKQFVEKVSQELNLPLVTGISSVDLKNQKGSLEDNARRERFLFFERTIKKLNADHLVLGHHKDDLAETVLMRLIRGTGLQGLRAIQPKVLIEEMSVVRPLLAVSKQGIIQFLKQNNILHIEDPSNESRDFFRNQIRLDILPFLKNQFPQLPDHLSQLSESSGQDFDYLNLTAKKIFDDVCKGTEKKCSFQLNELSSQHRSIQRYLFRLAVEHLAGSTSQLTFQHIFEIEDLIENRPERSVVDLIADIKVEKSDKEIIFKLI